MYSGREKGRKPSLVSESLRRQHSRASASETTLPDLSNWPGNFVLAQLRGMSDTLAIGSIPRLRAHLRRQRRLLRIKQPRRTIVVLAYSYEVEPNQTI